MNKEFLKWLEEQTYKINSKIHPPNKGKDRIDWIDETYWSKNRYINPEFKQWLTEQKYYRAISNIEYWVVRPFFKSQREWTWEEMIGESSREIKLGVTSRENK
jgi:hypothetical protein